MSIRELPSGTVTFLFSDIKGSTGLLRELGDEYADLLQDHRRIFREAIDKHGGIEISTEGDSFFVVFPRPLEAVRTAADAQRSLAEHNFPLPVRVRVGLHTGEGLLAGGDYIGIDVHRAARIASAGHGGQVLLSDATRALVEPDLPEDLTMRDLGPHRLTDLPHPERLYQLVVQGLPSDFPPPKSLDARPNNLPLPLTRFIGRRKEVSDIKNRLLNGARLLTLTGPGGTGKTRLAIEVAAEALGAFEDGAWFVDLAPITEAGSVVSTIAELLGVTETPGRPLQDALEASLKDKAMLVVLDNFEQVVEAGAAVERLIQAAPRLKVLVTSRSVLHRYGEQEFPVPPLGLPDQSDASDVTSLSKCEAIGLFLERATAVKPDFALTEDNAWAVAELAIRLDGLPLAIELAASRVNILPPHAILQRLGQDSPLLVSRVSDAPTRQRTLRGAIEWSYELLKESERRLFEQMSVFQGGGSLEAIESVCAAGPGVDVLEGVASLVDHSLLRQMETEHGDPRFVMLETIRAYAAERLGEAPGSGAAARRAHAMYFAEFARGQWASLAGPRRESALIAMATDVENLRAAWRHWVADADLDHLNELVNSLWLFFDARGWYHATVEIATDLLRLLSSTPSTPERAMQEVMLRTSLARALMAIHGYTQEVEDAFLQALQLFEGQREVPQLFPVLRGLASFYTYRAEFEKGAQTGREILRLGEVQQDPSIRVEGDLVLGSSMAFQGDIHGGLEHLDRAIASFESHGYRSPPFRLGNNPGVACLTTSAILLWLLGYPDRALERANRAVALATELGHPSTLAYALFHTGFLHVWRREPELVRDRAKRVVQVAAEHDLQIWVAVGRCLLGSAETTMGRFEEGLSEINQGLDLYQGLRTPPVFWPLLLSLRARAFAQAGRPEEGLGLVQEALALAGFKGPLVPEFYLLEGDLLLALANEEDAEARFHKAFEIARNLDARMSQLRAGLRLYRLSGDRGALEQGDRALHALYESFSEGFGTVDLIEARDLLDSQS